MTQTATAHLSSWVDRSWDPLGTLCREPCCAAFFARCKTAEIRRWFTSQRVFVGPHLLFDDVNPDEDIRDVFITMARAQMHTFKVLTHDADRMSQWFGSWAAHEAEETLEVYGIDWPPQNVHLGIRITRQQELDEQSASLLLTPAQGRFIWIDPLFGDLDLTSVACMEEEEEVNVLLEGIDQVILGCDAENTPDLWISHIVEQCLNYGVNFQQVRGSSDSSQQWNHRGR